MNNQPYPNYGDYPQPSGLPQGQYPHHTQYPGHLPSQPVQGQYQQPYAPVAQSQSQAYNQQVLPPMNNQNASLTSGMVQPSAPVLPTKYEGEMPSEDLDENAVSSNTFQPPPPSYDFVVNGYESTGKQENVSVGPPPSFEESQLDPALVDSASAQQLTREDAREALLMLVKQKTCWGKGAAENMDINDVLSSSAYHYIMETYVEGRSTKYEQMPYRGGYIDGPENGPAPLPWEIICTPLELFKNETKLLEVPHTSVVKVCNVCYGSGINRCWKCHGRGRVRCSHCHGSGHRTVHRNGESERTTCSFCHGRGRKRCMTCQGAGCLTCSECQGYRQVRQFIRLTVKYENKVSEHVVERTDLPDELIKGVLGDTIFTQTAPRVRSIENFFDDEINKKSLELVSKHNLTWPNFKILQQRHTLRSVPVFECAFHYSDKRGRFWVYGHQKEVYTEDYPHTCCCCAIL